MPGIYRLVFADLPDRYSEVSGYRGKCRVFQDVKQGFILILSAPSGTGKTSIRNGLLQRRPEILRSISVTTRPRTPEEQHGVDYFFVSQQEFKKGIAQGAFAEWAEIYGHLYGTRTQTLREALQAKHIVLLEIDVDGAEQIRRRFPDAVAIFIVPPSLDVLEERLRRRGRDSEEEIQKRLERIPRELAAAHRYDYIVVNQNLNDAICRVEAIAVAETCRRSRVPFIPQGGIR